MAAPLYEVAWDPWYMEDPPANCEAWWRFNEGTGTTAEDETSNSNDGTLSGASWAAGYLPGFAVEFDGATINVNCGSDGSIDDLPAGDFTLLFLFCPTVLADNIPLLDKTSLRIELMANGRLRAWADFDVTDADYYSAVGDLAVDEWAFWMIAWNAVAKTFTITKNGVEVIYSATQAGAGNYVSDAAQDLILGGSGASWVTGYLDDVQIIGTEYAVADSLAVYQAIQHITTDVRKAVIEYGKNSQLPFDQQKASTGRMTLTVNNLSSKWCPEVTTSPLYPYVLPNKPFRMRAGLDGVTYPLFEGFLSSDNPKPDVRNQEATLKILDGLDYLGRADVNIALQEGQASGHLVGELLDAAGWHPAKRAIDTGIDTFDLFYTKDNPKCLNKIRDIDDAEIDFTYVDREGNLAHEDRHHRMIAPHTVSQGTFTEALDLSDMSYDYGVESVRNDIKCKVTPHVLQASAKIWELVDVDGSYAPTTVPYLEAGETQTFWGQFGNFAKNVSAALQRFSGAPQQASDEIRANSLADNSGADHSGVGDLGITVTIFADAVKIELENLTAAGYYITLLRIWGDLYSDENATIFRAEAAASQRRYQVRSLEITGGDYRSDVDLARNLVLYALAARKNPQPEIDNVRIVGDTDAHCAHVLGRTISDRITLTSPLFGINKDYFINRVKLTIPPGGDNPIALWTVIDAEADSGFWTLGVSTLGETTVLCY